MFSTLLDELVAQGMTEAQIAAAIGRSQATVNRVRNQKQLLAGWDAVEKLRALHRERLPQKYQGTQDRRAGKAA